MLSEQKKTILATTLPFFLICFGTFIVSDSGIFQQLALLLLFLLVVLLYGSLCSSLRSKTNNQQGSNMSNIKNLAIDIKQFYELVESTIKSDLHIMRSETEQIKHVVCDAAKQLTECFYGISCNASKQTQLVHSLLAAINTGDHGRELSDLKYACEKITEHEAAAIRLLQFEDIVVQIADNRIQYANDVDAFLKDIKALLDEYLDNIRMNRGAAGHLTTVTSTARFTRRKRLPPDRKAAQQQDMTEGGIELF